MRLSSRGPRRSEGSAPSSSSWSASELHDSEAGPCEPEPREEACGPERLRRTWRAAALGST
eukprot:1391457-Rhodomonas_salina.2